MPDLFERLKVFKGSLEPGQQEEFIYLIGAVRSEASTAPITAFRLRIEGAVGQPDQTCPLTGMRCPGCDNGKPTNSSRCRRCYIPLCAQTEDMFDDVQL